MVDKLNEKSTAAEDARRRAEELKNSANKLAFEARVKLNSLRGNKFLLALSMIWCGVGTDLGNLSVAVMMQQCHMRKLCVCNVFSVILCLGVILHTNFLLI